MSITREKILELGENFIRTKGYNAFSYQDISTEMGIKNAAVHYYFPTKANLGTSIVKTNIQRFEEMVENMHSLGFDEWKQLEAFIKIYVKSRRENKKCLVGSLGPAYNTLDGATQTELKKMIDLILKWLTQILESGKAKNIFTFKEDTQSKALAIFSGLVASLQIHGIVEKVDYKTYSQSILDNLRP